MSFHKTNKRLGPDGILLIYNRHTSDRIKSPIIQLVNYLSPIYTRHTSDRTRSPIPEILYNMIISKEQKWMVEHCYR